MLGIDGLLRQFGETHLERAENLGSAATRYARDLVLDPLLLQPLTHLRKGHGPHRLGVEDEHTQSVAAIQLIRRQDSRLFRHAQQAAGAGTHAATVVNNQQ